MKDMRMNHRACMTRAWEIAAAACAVFGGKRREYISEALRLVYRGIDRMAYLHMIVRDYDSLVPVVGVEEDVARAREIRYQKLAGVLSDFAYACTATRSEKVRESVVIEWKRIIRRVNALPDASTWIKYQEWLLVPMLKTNGL